MSPRLLALAFIAIASPLLAVEPLSKSFPIDFFRDVPSRNLKGLATRSDGRLIAGPVLTDLSGPALPGLLWCLEPAGENKWLVGTGPDGKIVEVSLEAKGASYTVQPVADLEEPQVLALKRLPDGAILAGTSPNGVLALIRDGKVVASVGLPSDSIFDLTLRNNRAYVAAGNPGRIYEVDLQKFAAAGVAKERIRATSGLAAQGISIFGEIRDRNVRRIAWLGERLIAGSSPRGNLYAFAATGGGPQVIQENRDAEVAALLPQANGDLFAAIVFTNTQRENRIDRGTTPPAGSAASSAPSSGSESSSASSTTPQQPADRFPGRSNVVYVPKDGFPETVVARAGLAFYALARRGDTLVIAGGEQGDVLGYDTVSRQSLSFAGSDSAQINAIAPVASAGQETSANRFLALRNNAPGLALIDFSAGGVRSAETRRMDLGVPATLGALRLARLKNTLPENVSLELRANLGSDEIEGWTPWITPERRADGWVASGLRARNVKLRILVDTTKGGEPEIDNATLYYLPQNRRPVLAEFHIAPPNFALIPPSEGSPSVTTTLGQLLSATDREDRRKLSLTSAYVVPQTGNQIVTWNVTDPDGDVVNCTFSIRKEGSDAWTDIAVGARDGFAQFNTAHLEDGVYATRLVAAEQAPRPAADRLTITFATEELVIDNTPPEIAELKLTREADGLRVSVSGHDALSLLDGVEYVFNNGYREIVTQPADGIRDSQTETFVLQAPAAKLVGATSVEVVLYDAVGNTTAKRATLP